MAFSPLCSEILSWENPELTQKISWVIKALTITGCAGCQPRTKSFLKCQSFKQTSIFKLISVAVLLGSIISRRTNTGTFSSTNYRNLCMQWMQRGKWCHQETSVDGAFLPQFTQWNTAVSKHQTQGINRSKVPLMFIITNNNSSSVTETYEAVCL